MHYHSHAPSPPLGALIHRFWHLPSAPSCPRVRVLPRGTVELIVNLSDDVIRIYDATRPDRYERFPGVVVSGAYGGALDIDPMQQASMLGVHFRPGGAFPFFGAAIGEIADRHVALADLWGRAASELRERLCAAATTGARFQILEASLTARLGQATPHPAVALALDMFGPAGTGESIRGAARRVGLSERHFIQVFSAHVGLTPKTFCRVLRFQRVRELVDRAATPNWPQVALACGYYDQSHLIRDFQRLSGLRPTDYLGLRSNKLAPNLAMDG